MSGSELFGLQGISQAIIGKLRPDLVGAMANNRNNRVTA